MKRYLVQTSSVNIKPSWETLYKPMLPHDKGLAGKEDKWGRMNVK